MLTNRINVIALAIAAMLLVGPVVAKQPRMLRLAQLDVQGSRFPTEAFRRTLRLDPDVLDAIASDKSPVEIAALLKIRTRAALQAMGIVDAEVEVGIHPAELADDIRDDAEAELPTVIRINVCEGPQYRFGQLRVEGADTELARDVTTRFETVEPGGVVPLDEVSLSHLLPQAVKRLADAGYPLARCRVEPRLHAASHIADYVIVVEDLGRPAVIDRIEIVGNERNSDAVIRQFADLRCGFIFNQAEKSRIERTLIESGRFHHAEVNLELPEMEEDVFAMRVAVVELDRVSTLDQSLSREEQTLVEAGRWMQRFADAEVDLVLQYGPFHGVLSARDGLFVMIGRPSASPEPAAEDQSNEEQAEPVAALLLEADGIVLDLFDSRSRLRLPVFDLGFKAEAEIVPKPKSDARSDSVKSLRIGGAVEKRRPGDPFIDIAIAVPPGIMLELQQLVSWRWEDDSMIAVWDDDPEDLEASSDEPDNSIASSLQMIRIDTMSRRLVLASDHLPGTIDLTFRPGAFQEAKYRNQRRANRFVDVNMDRPIEVLLTTLCKEIGLSELPESIAALVGTLEIVPWLFREGLLHRMDAEGNGVEAAPSALSDGIPVLLGDPYRLGYGDDSCEDLVAHGFYWVDLSFPADSWPHLLASAMIAGRSEQPELLHWYRRAYRAFYAEDQDGPLVDLLRRQFAGDQQEDIRYFTWRCSNNLSAAAFRRDYEPLVDDRYLCGQIVQGSLDIMSRAEPEKLDSMLERAVPPVAAVIKRLVGHMHSNSDQTLDRRVRGALDAYWLSDLQPKVAEQLRTNDQRQMLRR